MSRRMVGKVEKQEGAVSTKAEMQPERPLTKPATPPETHGQSVTESIFVMLPKKPLAEITGLDVPRGVDPDLLAIECDKS